MKPKKTHSTFVKQSRDIHGDKYEYLEEYKCAKYMALSYKHQIIIFMVKMDAPSVHDLNRVQWLSRILNS
jgi:hypothetical protein